MVNPARPRSLSRYILRALYAVTAAMALTACDIPGLGPDPRIVQRDAEAKAVGGACRHAMRGLEDCYTLNPKASKAQVFAGWREMDQYMRENKVEGVPSILTQVDKPADKKPRSSDAEAGERG